MALFNVYVYILCPHSLSSFLESPHNRALGGNLDYPQFTHLGAAAFWLCGWKGYRVKSSGMREDVSV